MPRRPRTPPRTGREGIPRARALPARLAVSALAAAHRRQRGAEPGAGEVAPGGAHQTCGRHRCLGRRGPAAEAAVLELEQREELFAAIAALRPDERLAVIGRFFLGLTDEETAAALGVRRGAVKMRVFRALERLRVELEGPA
jgi:RNA polymerase sigma factor (sigma-70 family)